MVTALDALDCGEDVAKAVIDWFGAPKDDTNGAGVWKMRTGEIVREIGIGLLEAGGVRLAASAFLLLKLTAGSSQYGFRPLKTFESSWVALCGSFSPLCTLPLLAVRAPARSPRTD